MKSALALCCMAFAAAGAVRAETPPAGEAAPEHPDCPFLELNGVAMLDERTAILDMSTRVNAPSRHRRWFKVTFVSNCRRLKGSHFFELESAGCPRRGDVIVFSRRPFASEEDTDSCTIDKAEEVPVQGEGATPQP